jgi:hypothetical protein
LVVGEEPDDRGLRRLGLGRGGHAHQRHSSARPHQCEINLFLRFFWAGCFWLCSGRRCSLGCLCIVRLPLCCALFTSTIFPLNVLSLSLSRVGQPTCERCQIPLGRPLRRLSSPPHSTRITFTIQWAEWREMWVCVTAKAFHSTDYRHPRGRGDWRLRLDGRTIRKRSRGGDAVACYLSGGGGGG